MQKQLPPQQLPRLRREALQIWQAGVEAVRSERLVRDWCHIVGDSLRVGDALLPLGSIGRVVVVGAGKAGAGMAEAVETVLGQRVMEEKRLEGWVNVPDDCVRRLQRIHLHAARPAGMNEPTTEGAVGTAKILQLVQSLGPDDLCLCLLSGGGSALMPSPVDGIDLADKLAVTRYLSGAGANIEQLNVVRKQLSRIKGGGLSRACNAGYLVSLIISDVLGDPLDVIASGPTVHDSSTPEAALAVLEQFSACEGDISPAVFEYLRKGVYLRKEAIRRDVASEQELPQRRLTANYVIGNNGTAVAAAAEEARRLGYSVSAASASHCEGPAEQVGRELADAALKMRSGGDAACLVSGGEPVVKLVDSTRRGQGGRNQQLVLSALSRLSSDGASGIALLSGGTDGEDGPTNAAGALLDAGILAMAREKTLDPNDYLARNDAYHFFEPLDALIRTGPTHTNVCDVRIVVTRPE